LLLIVRCIRSPNERPARRATIPRDLVGAKSRAWKRQRTLNLLVAVGFESKRAIPLAVRSSQFADCWWQAFACSPHVPVVLEACAERPNSDFEVFAANFTRTMLSTSIMTDPTMRSALFPLLNANLRIHGVRIVVCICMNFS
jgi:hypothetical protein